MDNLSTKAKMKLAITEAITLVVAYNNDVYAKEVADGIIKMYKLLEISYSKLDVEYQELLLDTLNKAISIHTRN